MSRLKELRLHGFKSFADATRFVFEPGVNAVIGPNGSGKSNMADAVRWVLGEQSNRSLRTRRADDVIFAGSEQRRPQGMAEAILTLDNGDGWLPIDFAEVSVGRRAYRSGESEYLINGARARLRDVVELLGEGRLGANELVVVGQGTVDAALSLRPEERRQLFEEAAGVKGLQVRRNEASVRLTKARDNLTRVTDLIAELKPQVRRLALQAEHQQQHDALGARARALVIASHGRRERAARAALGEARRAAAAAEAALVAFRETQDAGRAAVRAAEERYWAAEEAARSAGHEREATREAVIRAEGRLEALDGRLRELAAALERETAELADARLELDSTDDEAVAAVAPALQRAAEAEEGWRAAVAELAAADEALLASEEAVADLRVRESDRIAAAARESEEAARRRARQEEATVERSQQVAAVDEARAAVAATKTALDDGEARATAARAALAERELDRDVAQAAADEARQAAVEVTERLRATRAELAAAEEPHDAETRLGRRLAAAGWSSLLDAIDAPEAAWPAVEAVVGGDLEGALLWTGDDPRDELGEARGAARLLAGANGEGADGRRAALDAVAGDRTLAEWTGSGDRTPLVFQRTAVARDVDALLDGWQRLPAGWSAVTPEGDLADGHGVIVLRGRADPPGGASARAHARRRVLTSAVGRMEEEARAAQEHAHAASERLRAARDAHLAASEAADEADAGLRRLRAESDSADDALARHTERLALLDAALADEPIPEAPDTAAAPPARLGELEAAADRARATRDERARLRDAAREAWNATRGEAEVLETRVAGRRRDRSLREARVAQLEAALPERTASVERLTAERDELEAAATTARQSDETASATQVRAEADRTARRTELLELERDQGGGSARLGELERAAQATAIEASVRDEALAALARERELALDGLPETDAVAPTEEIDALDDEALEAEVRRVRRTLAQIGSVNPFAVEEHREVAARLEEMSGQDADLRGDRLDRGAHRPPRRRDRGAVRRRLPRHRREVRRVLPPAVRRRIGLPPALGRHRWRRRRRHRDRRATAREAPPAPGDAVGR
jgi:chromosome segregation protein